MPHPWGPCVAFTRKGWLSRSFHSPGCQIPVLAYLRLWPFPPWQILCLSGWSTRKIFYCVTHGPLGVTLASTRMQPLAVHSCQEPKARWSAECLAGLGSWDRRRTMSFPWWNLDSHPSSATDLLLDLEVGQLGSDPARSVLLLLMLGSALLLDSGTLFSAINKTELEPAVALVMGSCWDLAIDYVTEAWGIVYHLQVGKAGSGVNALLLLSQDFLLKQAGCRASSLKIQTALC